MKRGGLPNRALPATGTTITSTTVSNQINTLLNAFNRNITNSSQNKRSNKELTSKIILTVYKDIVRCNQRNDEETGHKFKSIHSHYRLKFKKKTT